MARESPNISLFETPFPAKDTTADATIQRLRESEQRLKLALAAGQLGTYEFNPRTGDAIWDEGTYRVWGLSPGVQVSYDTVFQSILPVDRDRFAADVAAAFDPGGTARHDIIYQILLPDGETVRWIHAVGDVTFDDEGPIKMVGTVQDVTKQVQDQKRIDLLARELHHRVNSSFTVITGFASLLARRSRTPEEMSEKLRMRIEAMARSHRIILGAYAPDTAKQTQISLQELLGAVLEPVLDIDEPQVTVSGPELEVSANQASAIGIVIYEFLTNATKHGALSKMGGMVDISWAAQPTPDHLSLSWKESGGPEVSDTGRSGFGSTLTKTIVEQQLSGTLATAYDPSGIRHAITVPLAGTDG